MSSAGSGSAVFSPFRFLSGPRFHVPASPSVVAVVLVVVVVVLVSPSSPSLTPGAFTPGWGWGGGGGVGLCEFFFFSRPFVLVFLLGFYGFMVLWFLWCFGSLVW